MTMDRNAVSGVYNKQRELIIFGLTGRTGSGCTHVSSILGRKEFASLDLREPKTRGFIDADERKYEIVYDYTKNNGVKWIPFRTIEVSSLILSFVFEKGYDEFKEYLRKMSKNDTADRLVFSSEKVISETIQIKHMFDEISIYKLHDTSEYATLSSEELSRLVTFYYETLPSHKKKFCEIFQRLDCYEIESASDGIKRKRKYNLYSRLMQHFGNNLRCSSDPFLPEFVGELPSKLILRVENLISLLFHFNKKSNTRICIDAIRNPFEAQYLRDRYRVFYLLSINTDDVTRRKRLDNLTQIELENLDYIEYPPKLKECHEVFYHQDIQGCLESADIHIYNPNTLGGKYYMLTEQLIKYLALILHPGLIAPSAIERCMQFAYNAKLNSGCLSRQVGAIVTDQFYSVKAVGWNDVPKGQIACNLRDLRSYCTNKDEDTYSMYEICNKDFCDAADRLNKSIVEQTEGHHIPYCFKDVYNGMKEERNQVYTRSLHAEENAFLQIAKYGGQGLQGGYLFTTASPCELCAKKAYQLEIRKIFYIDPYPGISQEHILSFGRGNKPETHLFYGAIGNAYISLYSQRMALKDELALITGIDFKETAGKKETNEVINFDDVEYLSYLIEMNFISKDDIVCIREGTIKLLKDNVAEIKKEMYWTGSSYGHTELLSSSEGIAFCENTDNNRIKYTIRIDQPRKKDEIVQYKIGTYAYDGDHILDPYLAHTVTKKTQDLILRVKFPKGLLVDLEVAIYADKKMKYFIQSERGTMKSCEGEIETYEYSIKKPNPLYVYAIKWKFS